MRILDCTLRDGGRIINCSFPDEEIKNISRRLFDSNIDIIELGFLRDWREIDYKGNSTFFTKPEHMEQFIVDADKAMYVAFIDYHLFDFAYLPEYKKGSICGLRVGFTKKDYETDREDIIRCLSIVKDKGYLLFVQSVDSLGYSDMELMDIIEMVNDIHPYSFGIVDTYGAMYADDLQRIFTLVDHNLKQDICINFHSHNNFQMSFSFAQEIINMSRGIRKLIIDGTLNGMGKVAGNLSTELIVDYMNRKLGYNYDLDLILDTIDDYIYKYKKEYQWGYSIPGMMAGIYKSHPNNIIFLTNQFRLATKDIKYLLSMIEPELRKKYDYDNIRELYRKYNHENVDDTRNIQLLKSIIDNRDVLLLFPGKTIDECENLILEYIEKNNPLIISVNFVPQFCKVNDTYYFFGSEKRYIQYGSRAERTHCILVSNIRARKGDELLINYETLINRERENFDNTGIMLLNLMRRLSRGRFTIAGFDGFSETKKNYYQESEFGESRYKDRFEVLNESIKDNLCDYVKCLKRKEDVKFLTPSIYEYIFKD